MHCSKQIELGRINHSVMCVYHKVIGNERRHNLAKYHGLIGVEPALP